MAQWVWVQGQAKVAKKSKNTATPENAKLKTKNVFFRFQLEDLLNLWIVWTALWR